MSATTKKDQKDNIEINDIPSGPWTQDLKDYPCDEVSVKEHPEKYEFVHASLRCKVNRNTFYCWCGYVTLPESHPLFGKPMEVIEKLVVVHGDLTYGNKQEGVYGFDCGHLEDMHPMSAYLAKVMPNFKELDDSLFLGGKPRTYKDYQFVVRETKLLAEQLASKASR